MDLKKCIECGRLKPLNEFQKRKLSKDGRHYYCNECKAK